MSKKQKSTTNPSRFARPYITNAADTLRADIAGNRGNVEQLQGGLQTAIGSLTSRIGGTPLEQQARSYAGDVLGGRFLNNNPFMEGISQQARQGAFNDVASAFGRSGMTGSTDFARELGRGISQADLGVRFADYVRERDRMDAMAGNAGGIANSDLAAIGAMSGLTGQAAELPLMNARTLASGMGGLMGGYNTTVQRPSLGMMLMQGVSNAARAYAGGA